MSTPFTAKMSAMTASLVDALRRIPQEKFRTLSMVGIVFLLITLLGNNFWFFFSPKEQALGTAAHDASRQIAKHSAQQPRIHYDQVASWQLFGEEPAATDDETETVLDAVTDNIDENAIATNLNIRLVGVINASDPKEGFAIMQYSGETSLIKVGQAIPVGNDIFLAKVLIDRVIINNRGTFESLKLFDADGKLPVKTNVRTATNKKNKVLDKRRDKRVTELMAGYKKQLLTDPMSMANVIRVSLATDQTGQVVGYRVRPGSHRKQFAELGLKSGDIITAVNGISLSDQQSAMQLFQNLSSLTEATFDVKRGSSHLSIQVSLPN